MFRGSTVFKEKNGYWKYQELELKGQQLSREERKREFTWKSWGVASWYDVDDADAAATNTENADELCTSSATAKSTINAWFEKYSKWFPACFKIFRYWKWHIQLLLWCKL